MKQMIPEVLTHFHKGNLTLCIELETWFYCTESRPLMLLARSLNTWPFHLLKKASKGLIRGKPVAVSSVEQVWTPARPRPRRFFGPLKYTGTCFLNRGPLILCLHRLLTTAILSPCVERTKQKGWQCYWMIFKSSASMGHFTTPQIWHSATPKFLHWYVQKTYIKLILGFLSNMVNAYV